MILAGPFCLGDPAHARNAARDPSTWLSAFTQVVQIAKGESTRCARTASQMKPLELSVGLSIWRERRQVKKELRTSCSRPPPVLMKNWSDLMRTAGELGEFRDPGSARSRIRGRISASILLRNPEEFGI